MEARLYYECHITVEPVFEETREELSTIAKPFGFRLAELLMQKNREHDPIRSTYDTFMTAHSKNYEDIFQRMKNCVAAIEAEGFKVWRYKIEDTLFDTKHGDKLEP
jgi:hypothetical protein